MGLLSSLSGTPNSVTPQLQRGVGTEAHLLVKGERDRQQLKTFTRWWSAELPKGYVLPAGGLVEGVAASVLPVVLLQALTQEPIRHILPEAINGNRLKKLENHQAFLDRIKSIGIDLVNIGAEDLADGNMTLILGLTWKLITHFSEGMLTEAGGTELLAWARKNAGTSASMTSWADAFQDGLALCSLLHKYDPNCGADPAMLRPADSCKNLELAFTIAHTKFGVPRLLDAADFGDSEQSQATDTRSLQTVSSGREPPRAKTSSALRCAALRAQANPNPGPDPAVPLPLSLCAVCAQIAPGSSIARGAGARGLLEASGGAGGQGGGSR